MNSAKAMYATYRLQLEPRFGFRDALAIVDYLAALGVSDVYTSPILHAERGSTHGYNVVDSEHLNPELGSEADFDAFTDALRARGLGHVFDMVPNHMGIAAGQNAWWADVLENGESSRFADFFDIEWAPPKASLQHRVLLPILGGQYGEVLERGELRLTREGGCFFLNYFDQRLPLAPRSTDGLLMGALSALPAAHPLRDELESVLSAVRHLPNAHATDEAARTERAREKEVIKRRLETVFVDEEAARAIDGVLAALNGVAGVPESFAGLDALLGRQNYRLSYWRVATEEINYRRFFDVNQLAAIRIEDPRVFAAVHALVFRLVREGRVTGLRLDHTDGLYHPAQYFAALREQIGDRYVVAEKILEPGEALPAWPIQGTTGYDFIRFNLGLFQDPAGEKPLTQLYERFVDSRDGFAVTVYRAKQSIMRLSLASEINMLAQMLERIAESDRRSRDFTLMSLRHAIVETMAAFSVYRTYVRPDGGREADDDKHITAATTLAARRNPEMNASIFAFLRDVLLLQPLSEPRVAFAMKFQQVSSPVMAKSVEDTAFYQYTRFVAHNEVGCDPAGWGVSADTFHARNRAQLEKWPQRMLASSTHDTKRGEDVRARLSVLTSAAEKWASWVEELRALTEKYRREGAPNRNDEYLFYQSALGAFGWDDDAASLRDRLVAYMAKASKEAKLDTSWINPNSAYDEALEAFVRGAIDDGKFVAALERMREHVARPGIVNALAQVAVKMISPGVVDTYQGCELWNFSLVDPDNRRAVDYARARKLLARCQETRDRAALCRELLAQPEDGAVKFFVTWVALQHRQRTPELFSSGDYAALRSPEDVVAIARTHGDARAICIAPRFAYRRAGPEWPLGKAWKNDTLSLPDGRFTNLLTGAQVNGGAVALGELLADFPIAWLA